jgi:hypothetical protein
MLPRNNASASWRSARPALPLGSRSLSTAALGPPAAGLTVAPCSWAPEESQIESCEHQDNANVRRQPFPESVSEEGEIYASYDGYHRHHVKRDSDLSTRFRLHGLYRNGRNVFPGNGPCSGEFCDQQWLKLTPSSRSLLSEADIEIA